MCCECCRCCVRWECEGGFGSCVLTKTIIMVCGVQPQQKAVTRSVRLQSVSMCVVERLLSDAECVHAWDVPNSVRVFCVVCCVRGA